ncbi:hypothetical protein KP509_10G076400 [Ceratopteris richardii]|uniref:Pectinesterase n=1 Tax=Ceratopteris richardii TaxID=49495 RepID=A0A8T2U6C8_CERRI|nr:hypothetical protein KP509_10G076400 [Ceratopteris richardii]
MVCLQGRKSLYILATLMMVVGKGLSRGHSAMRVVEAVVNLSINGSRSMGSRGEVSDVKNGTMIEQELMQWVHYVDNLTNHTVFGVAKNVFTPSSTLRVDGKPGNGHYTSIQQAIDSVPAYNVHRVIIQISPGTYNEKVKIPWNKPYITLQGSGYSSQCVIVWNDTADKVGDDGKPIGTFNTATVAIDAPYFIARNLTFKNAAPHPTSGAKNKQASAIRVSGDASAFTGCQFLGAQDTLYDHKGRHFFQDCYVEGSVDFIFGDGLSMYQNCHLHAIGARYEALAAQSRSSPLEDSGFSFVNCKVTGSGLLYLGRAWGSFSRVVYAYTYMGNIIVPQGWYDWGDPTRERTVYYGEYKCSGPGANLKGRVAWSRQLSDEEAQPFLDLNFVDGSEWIGQ